MTRTNRNDKRGRLVDAADVLIYQQSFHNTTLADIAKLAEVPLGNVYYYFKTKSDIIVAVLSKRAHDLQALFDQLSQAATPEARLAGFIEFFSSNENIARFGCQFGSLCQELSKQPEHQDIAKQAAQLISTLIGWVEQQFKAMNQSEPAAKQNAEQFFCKLQGLCLLSLIFRDPQLLAKESASLNHWVADFA
jgi:TetR/AcrR family transcriptional repressor of nem operon